MASPAHPRRARRTPALSTSAPSPCRTVAASHPKHAARSASSVSLLPGTSTVGASIVASASTVGSRPRWTDARSPAQNDVDGPGGLDQACCGVEVRVHVAKARILTPGAENVPLGVSPRCARSPTREREMNEQYPVQFAVDYPDRAARPADDVLPHLRAIPILIVLGASRRYRGSWTYGDRRRPASSAAGGLLFFASAADDPVPPEVPALVVRLEPRAAAVHEPGRAPTWR